MIYLIKTSVFIEGDTEELDENVMALKIGYSRDERGDGRFKDYNDNGLSLRVLKTIPGGSYKLETKLHNLFKNYNIPSKSREWYYYNEDIVRVFRKCYTITDLYGLFGVEDEAGLLKENYMSKSERYRENQELLMCISDFEKAYSSEYTKVYSMLKKLQQIPLFQERMKLICKNDLTEEEFKVFLSYLPNVYIDYYTTLGPDRIESLSFRRDQLKHDYERIKNNQSIDLKDEIIKLFIVGKRYSLPEIKQSLSDLYSRYNYKKTPKAVDIKNIFDIKACSIFITDEQGNKQKLNGFEILKLKT